VTFPPFLLSVGSKIDVHTDPSNSNTENHIRVCIVVLQKVTDRELFIVFILSKSESTIKRTTE
jgi:hypothetical protein